VIIDLPEVVNAAGNIVRSCVDPFSERACTQSALRSRLMGSNFSPYRGKIRRSDRRDASNGRHHDVRDAQEQKVL
jgi:hypothetical protein